MKKLLISLIVIAFVTPAIAFADGKADFNVKCNSCHGGSATTSVKWAKMLNIDPKKLYLANSEMSKAEMITVIEKGRGKMPGFEKELTKEQIKAVVNYVRGLSHKK